VAQRFQEVSRIKTWLLACRSLRVCEKIPKVNGSANVYVCNQFLSKVLQTSISADTTISGFFFTRSESFGETVARHPV
jgi:hypothetical protein